MRGRLGVASEVDSYCTRCKLDLTHRIIAMVGETIKRVECQTCHGQHAYHPPKSGGSTSRTAEGGIRRRGEEAGRPAASRASAPAKPPMSVRSSERSRWERAIMGRAPEEFAAYAMGIVFGVGQLVRHAKFGDGVVVAVPDPGKVTILFETGPRTLVQGRAPA